MRPARARPVACLALVAAGCGGPAPSALPDAGPATATAVRVEGPIVARVDGEPIALADVEAVARATGLSPADALRRIEDEALLFHAATRAGTTTDRELERTARRALVQAYLTEEIEAQVTDATLDTEAVRARIETDRHLFERPERRASTHALVRHRTRSARLDAADEAAIAALADRIAADLRAAADPAAAAHANWASGATPEDARYEVIVEDVPASALVGRLDPAYTAALFALAEPGDVSDPTTSSFGVHVIVLGEIVPAFSAPAAEIETIVRRQMVAEARAAALVALEDRLLAEHPAQLDEALASRLLATDLAALGPP